MRPSTIDRLPESVRDLIGELRRNGRTIDEILDALRGIDVGVSRSALGRHTARVDAVGARIRESRAVATALVERYGEAPERRTARMNIELMHGILMRLLAPENGEPLELTPRDVAALATALRSLGLAAKTDVEREAEERRAFAAEAVTAVRRAGLSADTVDAVRKALEPMAEAA